MNNIASFFFNNTIIAAILESKTIDAAAYHRFLPLYTWKSSAVSTEQSKYLLTIRVSAQNFSRSSFFVGLVTHSSMAGNGRESGLGLCLSHGCHIEREAALLSRFARCFFWLRCIFRSCSCLLQCTFIILSISRLPGCINTQDYSVFIQIRVVERAIKHTISTTWIVRSSFTCCRFCAKEAIVCVNVCSRFRHADHALST